MWQLLNGIRHWLDEGCVGLLEGAGDALETYVELLGVALAKVPSPRLQATLDSVKRHALAAALGGDFPPKGACRIP